MKSFNCMPAVQTPEAPRDTRHLPIPGSRLPLEVIGSATPTKSDFGANTPFTLVPACKPPCLRFAVAVTGHHARLATRRLAKLYRGGHPRPPNFMRFARRNAPETSHCCREIASAVFGYPNTAAKRLKKRISRLKTIRQDRDHTVWGVVAAGEGIGAGLVLCSSVAVEGMECPGRSRSCATV